MEQRSALKTSSLQASLSLSTTNNILASSLSTGLFENKLLQPSIGVKRQNSQTVEECVRKLSKTINTKKSFVTSSSISTLDNPLSKSIASSGSSFSSGLKTSSSRSTSLSTRSTLSTSSINASSSVSSSLSVPSSIVGPQKKDIKAEESKIIIKQDSFPVYSNLNVDNATFKKPKQVFNRAADNQKTQEADKKKVR